MRRNKTLKQLRASQNWQNRLLLLLSPPTNGCGLMSSCMGWNGTNWCLDFVEMAFEVEGLLRAERHRSTPFFCLKRIGASYVQKNFPQSLEQLALYVPVCDCTLSPHHCPTSYRLVRLHEDREKGRCEHPGNLVRCGGTGLGSCFCSYKHTMEIPSVYT